MRYARLSAGQPHGVGLSEAIRRDRHLDDPTLGTEPVRIGVFSPDGAWRDQRDHLVDYVGYCWIDNFAGTPSISLPMGFGDNGLPVGVQFAAHPGGEALLLALAYQLETAVPWWRYTPPLWVADN